MFVSTQFTGGSGWYIDRLPVGELIKKEQDQ